MNRLALLVTLLSFPAFGQVTYGGFQVTAAQNLGVTYNAYSYTAPAATPGLALMGGWETQADTGDDKLYMTPTGTVHLTPVQWTNPGFQPGLVPGYHSNDPTVVAAPGPGRTGWLYMYFTCLPDADETFPLYFEHNHVCWASSVDGGQHWTFLNEAIGQSNGIDDRGAWSPSAWVSPYGVIALFYNTNSYDQSNNNVGVEVRMTLLDGNGWQPLYSRHMIDTSTNGPLQASNVQVSFQDVQWLLVGNGGSSVAGFNNIVAFVSSDLQTWTPWKGGLDPTMVSGEFFNTNLYTPEWEPTGPHTGNLLFSYGATGSVTLGQWSVRLN
jgi:hypothetical protein